MVLLSKITHNGRYFKRGAVLRDITKPYKMIKYLMVLPFLFLCFSNVSGQHLKLWRNTLFFTILFSLIAFDGFSQNCPPTIRASSNRNRLFLEYDPINTLGAGACLTNADALAAGVDGVTYQGDSYSLTIFNDDLRSNNGSGGISAAMSL